MAPTGFSAQLQLSSQPARWAEGLHSDGRKPYWEGGYRGFAGEPSGEDEDGASFPARQWENQLVRAAPAQFIQHHSLIHLHTVVIAGGLPVSRNLPKGQRALGLQRFAAMANALTHSTGNTKLDW